MNKLIAALALTALVAPGAAMAQKMGAPKAGSTRDEALDAAAKAFGRLDANGDGSVDTAEMTTVLQARATKNGKTFRPQAVTRQMSRNDANGDGKVTLDEYKAAAGARFDQADTNKNGKIDPEEGGGAGNASDTGSK